MNENRKIVEDKPEIVKGMDLRISEFNNDIVTAINKANLPAQALVYILTDWINVMMGKATEATAQQQKAYNEAVEGVKEDGN